MWLEVADHQQVKLGTFRAKRLPCLDQLNKPLVTDHAAHETYHLGIEWNAIASPRGGPDRAAETRRVECRFGSDAVDAAVVEDRNLVRPAQPLRHRGLTERGTDTEDLVRQQARHLFGPPQQPPLQPRGRHERQAVHVVDPHRHARQPRPQHAEQPALRRVGVDDVRPHLAQPAPQPGRRGQVAQRRDAPRHLQVVNRDALVRGKLVEQLAR